MRCIFILLLSVLFLNDFYSQTLVLEGNIRCAYQGNVKTMSGAENILIYPNVSPKSVVSTETETFGHYEIHTDIPFYSVLDKSIRLKIITNCDEHKTIAVTKFISTDQIKQKKISNGKFYVPVKTIKIKENCDSLKFEVSVLEEMISDISENIPSDIKKVKNDHLAGLPPLLKYLAYLIPVALAPPRPDSITTEIEPIDVISGENARIGYLPLLTTSILSSNQGFNFAPSRNKSEAVFWNPSALVLDDTQKKVWISSFSNIWNFWRISGGIKIGDKFAIGCGAMFLNQAENKFILVDRDTIDETYLKTKERLINLSLAYKLNSKLSIAGSVKFMKQSIDNPQNLLARHEWLNGSIRFTDYSIIENKIERKNFDCDLSLTYLPSNNLQLGLYVSSVLNTKALQDRFLVNQNAQFVNTHFLGLGINYKFQRFNIGVDVLTNNSEYKNVVMGINFIPLNNLTVNFGYSYFENAHSVGIKIRRFQLTYINSFGTIKNRDFLGLENLYIHSGFTFKF